MFDEKGNCIHHNSTSSSPIPYSPLTPKEQDEEYILIDEEKQAVPKLNKESCELIKELTQVYPLLDQVFPDLPYNEKNSYEEALDRRNQLIKVKNLAKATFPANFNLTYLDARQNYFDFRGYCNHNLTFDINRPHCNKCPEANIKLQGYHVQDYQYYLDNQPKATF